MSPALMHVLINLKSALKRDLDVLGNLLEQKKEEYIKVSSMLYQMADNLEMMESEHTEKVIINCDPTEEELNGV